MSNTDLIIEERSRDIGDFLVGRLLPFRKKRMVGPFIFIDHMGPSTIAPGHYMDIGQHPHIGLSTLTYLFEGEMMHRDSVGSAQLITPGSVNWMTAGHGVVHTERTPPHLRDGGQYPVHGYQIWVALPKHLEEMDPEFHHISKDQLPQWVDQGVQFTLVAGQGYGHQSPVPVHSPLFMLHLESEEEVSFDIKGQLEGEIGICIVEGYIVACGNRVEQGNMLVSKTEDACQLTIGANTRLLLFGGQAFEEERFIYWNFVSSDKAKIEAAKTRWAAHEFPPVPEETDYIPLPGF
ncbi:MAG: pirin family protein [Bacteroidota bacterium]